MEFKKGVSPVSRVSPALNVHFVGFVVKQHLSKKGDVMLNKRLTITEYQYWRISEGIVRLRKGYFSFHGFMSGKYQIHVPMKKIKISSLSIKDNKFLCKEFGGDLTYDELANLVGYLSLKKNTKKIIRSIIYTKEM